MGIGSHESLRKEYFVISIMLLLLRFVQIFLLGLMLCQLPSSFSRQNLSRKVMPIWITNKWWNLGCKTQFLIFVFHFLHILYIGSGNHFPCCALWFAGYMVYPIVLHSKRSGFLWRTIYCLQVIRSTGRKLCRIICISKLKNMREPPTIINRLSICHGL